METISKRQMKRNRIAERKRLGALSASERADQPMDAGAPPPPTTTAATTTFDRTANKVSGRSKKGGQKLKATSTLCVINCSDGSRHVVLSGVYGKLIEINERLTTEPQLVQQAVSLNCMIGRSLNWSDIMLIHTQLVSGQVFEAGIFHSLIRVRFWLRIRHTHTYRDDSRVSFQPCIVL